MEPTQIAIQYDSTSNELTDDLKEKVESRIQKLTKGHKDITAVTAAFQSITSDGSPKEYKVRIVLTMRGAALTAFERATTINSALSSALNNIERQVRDRRDKRRDVRRAATNTED